MSSKDKTERFWDKQAKQFDKLSVRFETPPIEKAKLYLKANDIVLDFGCATGTVTNEIASIVKNVTGIDISSKMIEIAKGKADELKIRNVDFKQATIFDAGLKSESFDAILAFNILHFFDDIPKVLQKIYELLKPEGLLIIATSCLRERTFSTTMQRFLFSPLIRMKIIPYMKFFKIPELKDSLGKAGFQVTVMENLKSRTDYFIVAKRM